MSGLVLEMEEPSGQNQPHLKLRPQLDEIPDRGSSQLGGAGTGWDARFPRASRALCRGKFCRSRNFPQETGQLLHSHFATKDNTVSGRYSLNSGMPSRAWSKGCWMCSTLFQWRKADSCRHATEPEQ